MTRFLTGGAPAATTLPRPFFGGRAPPSFFGGRAAPSFFGILGAFAAPCTAALGAASGAEMVGAEGEGEGEGAEDEGAEDEAAAGPVVVELA